MIGDTLDITASMRTTKYFSAYASKHKARVHQLDFIVEFIQANVKHIFFAKLDSRYGEYFPEYAKYFGGPLSLKRSMYGVTNYGKLFAG